MVAGEGLWQTRLADSRSMAGPLLLPHLLSNRRLPQCTAIKLDWSVPTSVTFMRCQGLASSALYLNWPICVEVSTLLPCG